MADANPLEVSDPLTPSSPTSEGRQFPVMQGKSKIAGPQRIPWSVAEKAYSVYSAHYGRYQSLERLAGRGGWYVEELDDYHPTWREEAGEIAALRASLTEAQAEIERLKAWRSDVTVALLRPGGAHYEDVPKHIKAMRQTLADLLEDWYQLAGDGVEVNPPDLIMGARRILGLDGAQ